MKKITAQYIVAKGFTLIELLIVIALLGALAIGLLATIDPFEQLKKGRDTSVRNTVSEFYNASLRYYSNKSAFPWAGTALTGSALSGLSAQVSELVSAGELKTQFWTLVGTTALAKMYVTSNGTDSVGVCFQPESKSFQKDINSKWDSAGGTSIVNCSSQTSGSGASCYYCVQ
ncbi:prepilin-type N-terminal cleavage/methylation domain-containing protein [Candidatus Gottesmanbacteria bacterium]|nr:prepilin-type N-terminal cleavage/methylation domain-containing protein [Candidatus Gottesmanbacteria bacterium]